MRSQIMQSPSLGFMSLLGRKRRIAEGDYRQSSGLPRQVSPVDYATVGVIESQRDYAIGFAEGFTTVAVVTRC